MCVRANVFYDNDFVYDSAYYVHLGIQGVVTPIGAVLTAETGDTKRSPGHGDFFPFGHGVTTVFRGISWSFGGQHTRQCSCNVLWSRGHSRISVDTNCVPSLSRKYSTSPMGVTTPWGWMV